MSKPVCAFCLPISLLLTFAAQAEDLPNLRLLPSPLAPELEVDLPAQTFDGLYPVAELGRFPADQAVNGIGFIADDETWARVWEGFQPDSVLPPVDFSHEIIIYARGSDPINLRGLYINPRDEHGVVSVSSFHTAIGFLGAIDEVQWRAIPIDRAGISYLSIGGQLLSVPSVPEPSTCALAFFTCLGSILALRRDQAASRR